MEEQFRITLGDENTFFVADSGNLFGIAFDKIFDQESLNVYNDFEMTSKRNFKNLSPQILETYQELFLVNGKFNEELALVLFNILNAKSQILQAKVREEFTSYETFISMIDKITDEGNNLLLNTINEYVSSNYGLELDKITKETKEKKKKVNEELQFSDTHAKALLKISYLYRIMIPLISVYFTYNKTSLTSVKDPKEDIDEGMIDENVEELEFDEVHSKIFAYLFEKFTKNPKALRNKLYKLTYSRIKKTSYSDKRFWAAAKNVAITKETVALEIYKKLLTNALPKLSIAKDKNVVSFLQSVVNNQIDFLFQNKFKNKLIPLSVETTRYGSDDDDDDVSEFEKIEMLTTRKDEGSFVIRKKNIERLVTLENVSSAFNVGISEEEITACMTSISRNYIQESLIAIMTFTFFQDKDALKYVDLRQYCLLLVACRKKLEAKHLVYLSKILVSNCEKHKERINICGKKVRPEILNSMLYKNTFDSAYKNFGAEIEKPFLSIIGTTYASVFKDNEGNEILDGTIKVAKIAEELLHLVKLMYTQNQN